MLTDPKGYFHIVSKDAGFDALVDMLKSRNAKVKGHEDWTTLNFQSTPKPSPAPVAGVGKHSVKIDSPGSKAIGVVALSAVALKLRGNLTKSPKNRPKQERTLITHAHNFTGKDKPETHAETVIAGLKKAMLISVDEKGTVT